MNHMVMGGQVKPHHMDPLSAGCFIVNLSRLEVLLASAALSGPGRVIWVCGCGGRVR